jgi:aldose 1-epimerase
MNDHLVTLYDSTSGARAQFLVGLGLNCFDFKAIPDGKTVDVLYAPAGFESGTLRPSSGGIPILFPFPGRLRGTQFDW